MRCKALLSAILLVLAASNLPAQGDGRGSSVPSLSAWPSFIVKVSPLALLEIPQPSIQVACEYRLRWPVYMQHEIGWLPPYQGLRIFEAGETNDGGKIKTEVRYYLGDPERDVAVSTRSYFALEGLYKIRVVRDEKWYELDGGEFSQWAVIDKHKQQLAFHFKYGLHVRLYRTSKVYMDSYVGIGLRRYFMDSFFISEDIIGEPADRDLSYSYYAPSLALGVKFGLGF